MTSTASLARSLMIAVAALMVVGAGVFAQEVDVPAEPPSAMAGHPASTPPTTEDPEPVVSLPTVVPGSGRSDGSTSPDGNDCPPADGRSLVAVDCDSDVSDPG
jgi:hypothetical protein